MKKLIHKNSAVYAAIFLYLLTSIIFLIENYFVVALIFGSFALFSFWEKQIFLDALLIMLFIIAMSSLMVFSPLPEIDKVKLDLTKKIVSVTVPFCIFLIYGYLLCIYKKPSKQQIFLIGIFILLACAFAIVAY